MAADDKEILYNVIGREVQNLTARVPMIGMFSGVITNYIINWIDPYVSAFLEAGANRSAALDADALSAFATKEVADKINKFKEEFNKERIGKL